jgi:hypothetical protein
MSEAKLIKFEEIQSRIFTLREVQVMIDSDLAQLYDVEIKVLNQAVKRNIERFPIEFMFQLQSDEYDFLRSQYVTLESGRGQHRKYLPYVFTEQGVAMLSAVLRSETAIKISIQIINAFVAMRRFYSINSQVFQRLDSIEIKQIETDRKLNMMLNAWENKDFIPKQGVFFDGQIFDAYKFVCDLVRKANKSIVIIDNYIDDTVLDILTKRNDNVQAMILTKNISKQLNLDLQKHRKQYPQIEIKEFSDSHDRFMIIDEKELYHFGASLKDLGKKWFAFSKMDIDTGDVLVKLKGLNK